MDLDDGRVHFDSLNLDADDLFFLQALENLVQNAVLGPTVHARVNGVPRAETLWQTTPLASLLSNIEQCVQKLQVGYPYVATLKRQLRFDPRKLRLSDLHLLKIS
jgi:hypothetical protein